MQDATYRDENFASLLIAYDSRSFSRNRFSALYSLQSGKELEWEREKKRKSRFIILRKTFKSANS